MKNSNNNDDSKQMINTDGCEALNEEDMLGD